MNCKTCDIEGHDSQGNKLLCYEAVVARCKRLEATWKGLLGLKLIAHPEGRRAMRGWVVETPKGKGLIEFIDSGTMDGKYRIEVFLVYPQREGPHESSLQFFDAADVRLL